jgi:hypothetical protein
VCSHLELLLSCLEWWRPRPERRAGWPLGEGRRLGGGDLAKLPVVDCGSCGEATGINRSQVALLGLAYLLSTCS